MTWIVHKFGGSSLADESCFRSVADILLSQREGNQAVVVSAMSGMTDLLLKLAEDATTEDVTESSIRALTERYGVVVKGLLSKSLGSEVLSQFSNDLADIRKALPLPSVVKEVPNQSGDIVSGFGELWSARLLSAFLSENSPSDESVLFIDARDVLVVESGEMGPILSQELTKKNLNSILPKNFKGRAVITGYIARTPDGLQTTLGRDGSDYSASIFGALFEASEVTIWTDVDGIMSGDPRRVPEATVIEELSYNEAMELAYFGATVIHPQAMAPLMAEGIPLLIRNTFRPEGLGTRIIASPQDRHGLVKGITGTENVALINLEGTGMIGVPGTADRLFGALREAGVSVILISQGSSEHSICFAVSQKFGAQVKNIVEQAFSIELAQGQVQKVEITNGCGVLAVVGDGMAGLPGIAGRFFHTLGSAGINVCAIAQGASERNISAVIGSKDMTRALRAVHASFYLSAKTISIGLIGPGSVGSVLLDQLASEVERLRISFSLDLRVRAICNSGVMLLEDQRANLTCWRDDFSRAEPLDIKRFSKHVKADHIPHAVLIDCTANKDVADCYEKWLEGGIHVITPNKLAHTGSIGAYKAIKGAGHSAGTHFLYEATVGAGLPIIQTLNDLVETGDEIKSISGIFSGTLAYLFNVFDGQQPFSEIVRKARALGYTEPDPREDLSGMDVARKAVILAREAGLSLELSDIEVESLVPESLIGVSLEHFMEELAVFDAPMAEKHEQAKRKNCLLRYAADLNLIDGTVGVKLGYYPPDHAFSSINLTDNIVQFVTRRYCDNPLIIRGPGAGPDVTAAGIFADLLRLCSMLRANHD